jgi:hypothetical protein
MVANVSSSRKFAGGMLAMAVVLVSVSCGEVARTGRSPAYLIIEALEGASGAEPDEFATILQSDVQTIVETTIGGQTVGVPTFFNDLGRIQIRLGLKNPGTAADPLTASDLNSITINRYRVVYRRSDGRNVQGVDVPYAFDGAFTVTVSGDARTTAGFDLVRHQAKLEPPLSRLPGLGGGIFISTIAEVTFFGYDQAGNEVVATGTISVNFGDFADPE